MPQGDHPGFEFWDPNDINHPFPVGEIEMGISTDGGGSASASIVLPPALPGPKVVAERFIGMARSAKLWFALRCERDALGAITCEAVLRGQHLGFWPEHGEADVGPLQEVHLTAGQLRAGGYHERISNHGEAHCDVFSAAINVWPAHVTCVLEAWHYHMTPQAFREKQEKAAREAYYGVPSSKPRGLVPEIPLPTPTPTPEPGPGPTPEPQPEPPPGT